MTVEEIYTAVKGDYADVLGRLMKPERVEKYLKKFAVATDYAQMLESLGMKDYESAFRFVHNLKGMSANLSLSVLFASSNELCEALRNGPPTVDIAPMLEKVKVDYAAVIEAISTLG